MAEALKKRLNRKKHPGSLRDRIGNYITEHGGLTARGSIDPVFFALLMVMVGVGLAMLYSATFVYAYYYEHDSFFYLKKQLFATGIGVAVMLLMSKVNYRVLAYIAAVGGTLLSWVLIFIARMQDPFNGTYRYIYNVPIVGQFQPSDVGKFALILTLAALLGCNHALVVSKKPLKNGLYKLFNRVTKNRFHISEEFLINRILRRPFVNESLKVILPAGILVAVYALLVFWQNHLSGTVLMLTIGLVILFFSEIRMKWFAAGAVGLAGAVVYVLKNDVLKGYMQDRFVAWLDKDFEPYGLRWQINNALNAIGSGGAFGKGFGKSTLKHMFVSEPQNDMIFSIVVEELGVFGAACIILLFVLLIWRGVSIAIRSRDRYGALLVLGVMFQIGVQMILNILVVTDSIPNTGISLPFFSYGGTAIFMLLFEMGFVLSVSRSSTVRKAL